MSFIYHKSQHMRESQDRCFVRIERERTFIWEMWLMRWRGDDIDQLIECIEPWTSVMTAIITPTVSSDTWQSVHTPPSWSPNMRLDIEAKGANYFLHSSRSGSDIGNRKSQKHHYFFNHLAWNVTLQCFYEFGPVSDEDGKFCKVIIIKSRIQILFTFIYFFFFLLVKKTKSSYFDSLTLSTYQWQSQ